MDLGDGEIVVEFVGYGFGLWIVNIHIGPALDIVKEIVIFEEVANEIWGQLLEPYGDTNFLEEGGEFGFFFGIGCFFIIID